MAILQANLQQMIIVIGFMFIHYYSKYFTLKKISVRSMLSFAAGVGVSYVIIHLFPQVAYAQEVLIDTFGWDSGIKSRYMIYVIVLLGFMTSYVIYRLDEDAFENLKKRDPNKLKSLHFWSDISFFAVYNAMIGYLVISKVFSGTTHMLVYFIAYGLHFLMNDWGLRHHHEELYDNIGRIILSLSIFIGGLLAVFIKFPYYIVLSFEAFIAGAMILNVVKFELPADNQGSITGFVAGAISSCVLFLLL